MCGTEYLSSSNHEFICRVPPYKCKRSETRNDRDEPSITLIRCISGTSLIWNSGYSRAHLDPEHEHSFPIDLNNQFNEWYFISYQCYAPVTKFIGIKTVPRAVNFESTSLIWLLASVISMEICAK